MVSKLLLVALSPALLAAPPEQAPPQPDDISILQPWERSYSEATKFVGLLRLNGFTVRSAHRSEFERAIGGTNKAAVIRMDEGTLEAVFLENAVDADRVQVTEERRAHRYLYIIQGAPEPTRSVIN